MEELLIGEVLSSFVGAITCVAGLVLLWGQATGESSIFHFFFLLPVFRPHSLVTPPPPTHVSPGKRESRVVLEPARGLELSYTHT